MHPELSIVIPTFNRAERLRACLDALGLQTQPAADFEVIVVDDGSTDGTAEMLETLATPFLLRVVLQKENSGYGAARNAGVSVASGEFLLFLDDDVVASPGLVAEHLRVQHQEGGAGVIGPYPQLLPRRAGRFARAMAEGRIEYYASLETKTPTFTSCHTGNFSAPRDAVQAVGGFAEDLPRAVDIELGYRLQQAGLRFVFAPAALGTEDQRESSSDMITDARVRGANALELWRRHPAIITYLRLGGHFEHTRRRAAIRLVLLNLRVSPRILDALGYVLPRASGRRRWYDFLYYYCYWQGVRRAVPDRDTWRRLTRGTPILMYHAIGQSGERASRYVLPVDRFERQMRWLKRRRYRVLELDEFVRCLREHRLPPAKSVVLTFDDGYADNRSLAAPILERLGLPATFFLVSAAGTRNSWDQNGATVGGRALMGLEQARELVGGVVSLGAHTRSHADLTALTSHELEAEIAGSRSELEVALGAPVTLFAYPYGKTNTEVREAVMQAGFLAACSVESGRNRLSVEPYMLKRLEVRGTDSLLRFALILWLGETRSLFRRRA